MMTVRDGRASFAILRFRRLIFHQRFSGPAVSAPTSSTLARSFDQNANKAVIALSVIELMASDRLQVDNGCVVAQRAVAASQWRRHRQLQHRGWLPGSQIREQDDFSIRKFHGVMMAVRARQVHLPEAGELAARLFLLEQSEERPAPSHIILERKFGPWQETNGHRRIIDACEASSDGVWE
jgi:hypothetical protein